MSEEETTDTRSPQAQHPGHRRLPRRIATLGVAVVLYALAGFLVVPRLVRWAVQRKGSQALHHRAVTLGEVSFNPFTLEARLRDLRIRDRDGQPLFSFDLLQLRLGPSGVFQRAWRLRELTFDKPSLQVRFLRDGKLSFADLLNSGDKSPLPRVIVDRLAIRGGRLDYADESRTPRFNTSFAPLNADVRDLITIPGERGEHVLSIGFDRNSMIRIVGKQTFEPFGLSGTIVASRIALPTLAEKLASNATLLLRSGQADISVNYELRSESSGVQLHVTRGELNATNLALASRENADLLTVPRVEVRETSIAFPARKVEVGSIRIIEPTATAGLNPQGQFSWPTGTAAPAKTSAEVKPAQAAPWKVTVAKVAIERGTLHFEDQQPSTPVRFDLTGVTIAGTGLSSDTSAPVAFTATAAEGSGNMAVSGSIVLSPFSIDCKSSLAAIDLIPFRPYAAAVPGLTLGAGSLGFDGRMLISPSQPYLIEGSGALNGIEFVDSSNNRLLGCRTATIREMSLDGATSRFRIRSVDLDGMYANVVIDKQHNLNLSAIGASKSSGATTPPTAKKGSVDIGRINIANSTIDYRDDSLVLPFATAITSTKGKISDFSTTSSAAGTIRLDGNVAEHGAMKAEGTVRMSDPFAGTDLAVHFRSVPMPALTPYSAEFAGYSIERGDLNLDLHYRIVNRELTGDHRIVATDLTLGKRVSGTRAGFAVRLAIALLKDRNGKIDMQVPIEGTVDSPDFNYRVVLWKAVKTILGNIVKAPFRALGRAMGIGGENLQVVSFESGESTVIPPEAEKLRKIAGELAARAELTLQIEGRFDSELDTAAMKKAKLEALIASRRDSPKGTAEPPSLEMILESIYVEVFSPDRLTQERARFTATPPPPPAAVPDRKLWPKKAAPPAPLPATFDAQGFYDAIRAQLLAAQSVSSDDLRSLGRARAAAIASVLTSAGTLAPERVTVLDPAETRKKPGSQQVESEMKLAARGPAPNEPPDD